MFSKTVSVMVLALLLTNILALMFNIQPVSASGTIYIRADGSIEPLTAPLFTADNTTYTLTDNITSNADGIVIERDNVTLDGAGYTIQALGGGTGTYLSGRTNVTVRNTQIKSFDDGIWLEGSSGNTVSGNNITNSTYFAIELYGSSGNTISGNNITNSTYWGIAPFSSSGNTISGNNITNSNNGLWLTSSPGNTLRGNVMVGNKNSFAVMGAGLQDFVDDVDVSNTVDGKPIYYWINVHDVTVPLDAGYVAIVNSTRVTLQNLDLTKNGQSVLLAYTTNTMITQNNITNSYFAIELHASSGNIVSGNNIANNAYGIWLFSSPGNTLRGNAMIGNTWCFGVHGAGLQDFVDDVDVSNTVDGKPIYYWINVHDVTVPLDAGYVAIVNSTRVTLQNLDLTKNDQSILLAYTTNTTIIKNNITNSNYGIQLVSSSGNIVSGNNIANNAYGIWLFSSSYNTVSGNKIAANNWYGIVMKSSSNNKFHHNNLVNNTLSQGLPTVQVNSDGSLNSWDDGYPSGGNYWGDYNGTDLYTGPNQNETGADGIGDVPFNIDANNTDRYPLMIPWTKLLGDTNSDETVDIYDALVLAAAFNSKPNSPNWNANADINGDNIVDIYDAIILAGNYGKTA